MGVLVFPVLLLDAGEKMHRCKAIGEVEYDKTYSLRQNFLHYRESTFELQMMQISNSLNYVHWLLYSVRTRYRFRLFI